MSDRDTLITAIAAEVQRLGTADPADVPDFIYALTSLGYRVVGPAEQAVLDAAEAARDGHGWPLLDLWDAVDARRSCGGAMAWRAVNGDLS